MSLSHTSAAFLRLAAAAALLGTGTVSAQAFAPIVSLGGEHRVIHPNGVADEILATQEETDGQLGIVVLGGTNGDGPGPAVVHAYRAEFWYVLEGQFEFHVGDKTINGGPGTFIAVDAGQPHGYIQKTAGKLLTIFSPGGYEHFFMDWDKKGLKPGPELGALENFYGVTRP